MFYKIYPYIKRQQILSTLSTINIRYVSIFKSFNFNQLIRRNINLNSIVRQKLKVESENNHVYNIMQSIPNYESSLARFVTSNQLTNEIIDQENFEKCLNKNWRAESGTNIVNTFKKLSNYSQLNNITLSDKRFDKLVDGLMDKCQDLTDIELSELLYSIKEYPRPETATSHNFHDIWSALDDICCARIQSWSIQKTLLFSDHWYRIGLVKYVNFTIQAIKKFCRKAKSLSPTELVQTLFYINVCRKQWSMFDIECRLQECINELSIDELAIVSMAFFKTETTIKEGFLVSQLLKRLLEKTSSVHEITLTAILKIIRYSPHLPFIDQINELLTKLIPEIDRLSILCCVHIALLGTNTQFFHPKILEKITEKFVQNFSATRLKDLERLIFTLTLFNFNPKTTSDIYQLVLNDLQNPARNDEISKFPRCLSCTVHYLGLQNIYSYDLIDKVLDPQFITNAYGANKKSIGREILFINTTIDIECLNYKGHRLNKKLQNNLTKWNSHWTPSRNQKFRLTAADKLMLDIVDSLEIVYGNNEYYHINYILPHFPKPDIIFCKDKNDKPVKNIKCFYEKYELGDLMIPEKIQGYKWYAIVIGSWNMFIRGTTVPVGTLAKKLTHLELIGYVPILVPWTEYLPLSRVEKENYLSKKVL